MKILYCITRSDTVGGAHIHVADMAAHMKRQGHAVDVIVGGCGVYADILSQRGINVISSRYLVRPISVTRDLGAVRELRALFRDVNPDVLSLHSAKAGVVGRLAAYGLGFPVVFTAHGWSFTEGISRSRAKFYRKLEASLARLADRIICVSEYDRKLALEYGVASFNQVMTIHNGMPDSPVRAAPGDGREPTRLISVARLDQQKDHATVFAALEGLKDFEWQLDLVGDGPLEESLRASVKRSGLDQRIRFLGLRQDVESLLSESHIFVLPSNWEGLPRSILEAMRAGLPVIASDVGGVSESVQDGVTGFLIARGDHGGFRNRIQRLLIDPETRAALGRRGRQVFEQSFLFEQMAAETSKVYETVTGGWR